jgi:hypothetical protein
MPKNRRHLGLNLSSSPRVTSDQQPADGVAGLCGSKSHEGVNSAQFSVSDDKEIDDTRRSVDQNTINEGISHIEQENDFTEAQENAVLLPHLQSARTVLRVEILEKIRKRGVEWSQQSMALIDSFEEGMSACLKKMRFWLYNDRII